LRLAEVIRARVSSLVDEVDEKDDDRLLELATLLALELGVCVLLAALVLDPVRNENQD